MDGAHGRLIRLEARAYRCLSRQEAQRILQEADALKGDLHSKVMAFDKTRPHQFPHAA